MSFNRDPIEGLVQYVNDIKPYHTKLIDVVVTYTHNENINVTVGENTLTTVTFDMDYAREPCLFGYDTDTYDFTAYGIPSFAYAIDHSEAYNYDCLLTGCERQYKTKLLTSISANTTITLPFFYLYNVETLYVYINGSLQHAGYEEVPSNIAPGPGVSDSDVLNTNKIIFTTALPANTVIFITTHKLGINNECWPELAASGYESHTFDEHGFDLTDPSLLRWPYGVNHPLTETSPFEFPELHTTDKCGCPPFIPYASPTSILPTITEEITFADMITFNDMINTSVFDWSDNWANGFDLTPWNSYNFDTSTLWDVINNTGYNFGVDGQPTLIKSDFTIIDMWQDNIVSAVSYTMSSTITLDNAVSKYPGFAVDSFETIPYDADETIGAITSTTIVELFNITEVIYFSDSIGVTVADPHMANGLIGWGQDEFWYVNYPEVTGPWNDTYAEWLQVPTGSGLVCDIPDFETNGCLTEQTTDSIITILSDRSDLSFVVNQDTPVLSIDVQHNLNRYPIIRVYNLSGQEIMPLSIVHLSQFAAQITFNIATACTVRCV